MRATVFLGVISFALFQATDSEAASYRYTSAPFSSAGYYGEVQPRSDFDDLWGIQYELGERLVVDVHFDDLTPNSTFDCNVGFGSNVCEIIEGNVIFGGPADPKTKLSNVSITVKDTALPIHGGSLLQEEFYSSFTFFGYVDANRNLKDWYFDYRDVPGTGRTAYRLQFDSFGWLAPGRVEYVYEFLRCPEPTQRDCEPDWREGGESSGAHWNTGSFGVIPLPASAWLLLGGISGMVALRRLRAS